MTSPATSRRRFNMLTLLALVALGLAALRTVAATDFWLHLACGRAIAEGGPRADQLFSFTLPTNQTWVNTSWLYDWILHAVWSAGGGPAVSILHALCVVTAFALLALLAGRRPEWSAGIPWAIALSTILIAPVLGTGPFLVAMPIMAAFLLVLDRQPCSISGVVTLVFLQVAWTNLHASFLLGPLAVLCVWADRMLNKSSTDAGDKNLLLATVGATLVATLANPHGFRMISTAVSAVSSGAGRIEPDWLSPFAALMGDAPGRWSTYAAMVVAIAGCLLWRQRLPLAQTIFGGFGLFLLLRAPALADMAAVLAFPFLALSLACCVQAIGGRGDPSRARLGTIANAVLSVLLVAMAWDAVSNRHLTRIGSAARFGAGVEKDTVPHLAVDQVLKQDNFPAPMLHLAMDGGYLAWALSDRPTFVDQRISLFSEKVYSPFVKGLLGDAESWKSTSLDWKPGSVLIGCAWPGSGPAVRTLLMDGSWGLAYMDGVSALLVNRRTPGSSALLMRKDLQQAGLLAVEEARTAYAAALGGLRSPGNPTRLIGAANVFQAMGRFREAEAIYTLLTKGNPHMTSAWLSLGICRVQLGRSMDAIDALERATRHTPENVLAWLWLSRALSESGEDLRATEAHDKAVSLNADVASAFFTTNATPPIVRQGGIEKLRGEKTP